MAVYVFEYRNTVLKVGKAGPKSNARSTSQHDNPGGAPSTLAASILKDAAHLERAATDQSAVSDWIRGHVDRVNILMPAERGMAVLTLLEAFLQCRLRPRYEGFMTQKRY